MTHLESVTADELRDLLGVVEGKRPTQRVMLGLNYKEEDITQPALAARYGVSEGTVYNWLSRLDRLGEEPVEEVLYDERRGPKPGASRRLSEAQSTELNEALAGSPEAVGYDGSAWTTDLARAYIAETFGVTYCRRHVRRLMTEAGLSCTTTRTESMPADDPASETDPDDGKRPRAWTGGRS